MRKIVVSRPQNDSLVAQLLTLYETLKNTDSKEDLDFDLSKLAWIYPLLLLPLSAYISTTKSKFSIGEFSKIKSYLDTIDFPNGVDSVSSFQQRIQQEKSYIPISVLKREAGIAREQLESLFIKMIYKTLGAGIEAQDAIYYPIGELVANIFEHSKQDRGFIFGQFYPTEEYLDICIVDQGRGLKAAYQQEKGLRLSDEDAIAQVMIGSSTKPDIARGYGVWTSKRVICEGLEGEFILVSGSAALISVIKDEKLVSFPNFYWQGVIIAYRIPRPKEPIEISQYLE